MIKYFLTIALLFLTPISSFALPLPTYVVTGFSGSLSAPTIGDVELSGIIQFELLYQKSSSVYSMDNVAWSFVGMDYSGALSFQGYFYNDWAFAHPNLPTDLTEAPWITSYWEGGASSLISSLGYNFYTGMDMFDGSSPNWIFADNSNFLPSNLLFSVWDGSTAGVLNLHLQPVPEPSTVFLLSAGALAIVAKRKFSKNRQIR